MQNIAVFARTNVGATLALDKLLENIPEQYIVSKTISYDGTTKVVLRGDTVYQTVLANDRVRGKSFDVAYVEKSVDMEIVYQIIAPCVTGYIGFI